MIATGVAGLAFLLSPRAAIITLSLVLLCCVLILALAALAALIAAGECDRHCRMDEAEVAKSGEELRKKLRAQIDADYAASQVILDKSVVSDFPRCAGKSSPKEDTLL